MKDFFGNLDTKTVLFGLVFVAVGVASHFGFEAWVPDPELANILTAVVTLVSSLMTFLIGDRNGAKRLGG